MAKPDGIKVRVLTAGSYGSAGDEVVLSTSVAEEQIAAGNVEAVKEVIDVNQEL